MTHINKQKFLAELGQFLSFMYEEDRSLTLELYGKMFDDAIDEVALLQYFLSPTRQAVVIARSYNEKEQRLQIHTQSKGEKATAEGTPSFVTKIEEIRADAEDKLLVRHPVDDNQMSLFEDEAFAAEAEAEPPLFAEIAAAPAAAVEVAAPAKEATEDAVDDFLKDFSLPAEVTGVPAEAAPAEAAQAPQGDIVFTITEDEPAAAQESAGDAPAVPAEAVPAEDTAAGEDETDEDDTDEGDTDEGDTDEDEDEGDTAEDEDDAPAAKRKARLLVLIPYIPVAVVLAVAGIALLTVPTVLSLVLACATLLGAVLAILVAFSGGFVVFADIMLVLGGALILLGFGLLFLWLFVWFIGGVMGGLVNGLISLGKRWGFKEVSVNE